MGTLELCNAIRIEAEGLSSKGLPIEIFPAKVQQIILDFAKYENYLVEYTAASFISAVSAALGNTFHFRIKNDWVTNGALYLILVGRPGLGKTPPLEAAFKPIREWDKKRFIKYKDEIAEQINRGKDANNANNVQPKLVKTILSDFTPEALMRAHDNNKRGVVVLVDEIMGMFNSVNQYNHGQLIEQLLTAFSGGSLNVVRLSNPMPIYIEHPYISIVGTTQLKRVHELFKKGYEDNGLIDRILFVMPKNQKVALWVNADENEPGSPSHAAQLWSAILNKVIDLEYKDDESTQPKILGMDANAKNHFFSWWNNILERFNAITDESEVKSRVMKRSLITARLALVFQVMRWACGESHLDFVDEESIKRAITMGNYFEECFNRIEKQVIADQLEPQKRDMLNLLPEQFSTAQAIAAGESVGISKRQVQYDLSAYASSKLLEKQARGEYRKRILNAD